VSSYEKALIAQNAKLIMTRLGDQEPDSGMLLRDAPGDSADPGRARYFALLGSYLIHQYVRNEPGRESATYVLSDFSLLGYCDPVTDEYHWRVQDDLETFVNAWRDSQLQQGVFDKVVAAGNGYAMAFCFFALRLAVVIRRREF
jgi:hypothetical protein